MGGGKLNTFTFLWLFSIGVQLKETSSPYPPSVEQPKSLNLPRRQFCTVLLCLLRRFGQLSIPRHLIGRRMTSPSTLLELGKPKYILCIFATFFFLPFLLTEKEGGSTEQCNVHFNKIYFKTCPSISNLHSMQNVVFCAVQLGTIVYKSY